MDTTASADVEAPDDARSGSLNGVLAVVAVAVIGTVVWGAAADYQPGLLASVAIGVTALEVVLLTQLAGGFTAVVVPVVLINSVLLGGLLFWDDVQLDALVSADLPGGDEVLSNALRIGLLFTGAFTAGALVARPAALAESAADRGRLPVRGLLFLGYAVLALTVYARGSALLRGAEYLAHTGPDWAVRISGSLAPLGVLALCVVAGQTRYRFVAVVGLAFWALVLLAMATRQLALLPVLFLVGRYLASGKRIRTPLIALAAIGTVFLAQLPLVFRNRDEGVGIITIGRLLVRDRTILAEFDPASVFGNILFAAPLTDRVSAQDIPLGFFATSINPLPGDWTDWPTVSQYLGLNDYTPYNGLGELAAQGALVLCGYAFVTGALLAIASRVARSFAGVRRLLAGLMVLTLASLFSLNILQYNLRSGTRLVYYVAAGIALFWVLERLFPGRDEGAAPDGAAPGQAEVVTPRDPQRP